MLWKKCGLIWSPEAGSDKFHRYGILPVPIYIKEHNIVRVFFGSADKNIHSKIYSLDLNPDNLNEVIRPPGKIKLDIGKPGTFDDSGVVPSYVIRIKDNLILYTVGFQRAEKVPYILFAGIAVSNDFGETFRRPHESPILPRNNFRPTSQGAPSVLYLNGKYKMWHWFSTKWIKINGKYFLDYKIGYAESKDGLNWKMKNITCLEPDNAKGEFALARPYVLYENEMFKMWYSKRLIGKGYRIGYAESIDGINWIRKDDLTGIDVSKDGWDSEMVCYPAILDLENKRYLFYNGNNNGATGFGYAELMKS